MMKEYKISIITISFNARNEIEQTILSVINQNYSNIEYIIIDGNSTDGTVDIIKKYSNHIAFWKSETDKGIYDAMNKGLSIASGDWVIFMNTGDLFFEKTVLSNVFRNNDYENKYVIYGNTQYFRENSQDIEIAKEPDYIKINMPTAHQSFFVRTNIAKEIMFDTKYMYAADYNMIYKIYKKYGQERIIHISSTISKYEAFLGLTMQCQNEVFHETLRIRDWSFNKAYCYIKYYVKKYIWRMK